MCFWFFIFCISAECVCVCCGFRCLVLVSFFETHASTKAGLSWRCWPEECSGWVAELKCHRHHRMLNGRCSTLGVDVVCWRVGRFRFVVILVHCATVLLGHRRFWRVAAWRPSWKSWILYFFNDVFGMVVSSWASTAVGLSFRMNTRPRDQDQINSDLERGSPAPLEFNTEKK